MDQQIKTPLPLGGLDAEPQTIPDLTLDERTIRTLAMLLGWDRDALRLLSVDHGGVLEVRGADRRRAQTGLGSNSDGSMITPITNVDCHYWEITLISTTFSRGRLDFKDSTGAVVAGAGMRMATHDGASPATNYAYYWCGWCTARSVELGFPSGGLTTVFEALGFAFPSR